MVDKKRYDVARVEEMIVGNRQPQLRRAIPEQSAIVDQRFVFGIPEDTFADPDSDDTLRLYEYFEDGAAWPSWLSFDCEVGIFSGTAGYEDIGIVRIDMRATDLDNGVAIGRLEITVVDEIE